MTTQVPAVPPVPRVPLAFALLALAAAASAAGTPDELRVKREAVFEFAQKPAVTREGDKITVVFEAKGFCDVTVAVEDAGGQGG